MKKSKALAVLWFALAILATSANAATSRTGQIVMGTVLEVTVVATDADVARQMADRAIDIARRWENVLTIWRPEGELARFNAQAGKGSVEISENLHLALTLMRELATDTKGAFDPAVGPLVAHYGSSGVARADPKAQHEIARVLTLEKTRAGLHAGAALDPGGIGKGIALDAIAEELRGGAVVGAFVDFGGSSQLAFGLSESGGPWRVAIAGVRPGEILGTIALDGALSTSRSRMAGDQSGPIVDPRNGTVVIEGRLATCLAASAALADAWSTALVVLGPSAIADGENPAIAALVQTADGEVVLSPEFARVLEPIGHQHDGAP